MDIWCMDTLYVLLKWETLIPTPPPHPSIPLSSTLKLNSLKNRGWKTEPQLRIPAQSLSSGSKLRTPDQDPSSESQLRIPAQSPSSGSQLRASAQDPSSEPQLRIPAQSLSSGSEMTDVFVSGSWSTTSWSRLWLDYDVDYD